MSMKKLILNELNINNRKETATFNRTRIVIKIEGTDTILFEGSNKVILAGSTYTAGKHFGIPIPHITPSYNTKLALDNSVFNEVHDPALEKISLYAIGTDGCGDSPAQQYEVNYNKWLNPVDMIPFRYPLLTNDLTPAEKPFYHGRKVGTDRVHYWFKSFETAPVWRQEYIDGTPIDENVYDSQKITPISSYVELKMKILQQDARDWFRQTTGISDARVNTITLLQGWKKNINGEIIYQDIHPVTKLNFPTEFLIDETKGLDIIYQIFY